MLPGLLKKKCCCNGGGGSCPCRCPCNTPGALVTCDGHKIWPTDGDMTLQTATTSVEMWTRLGSTTGSSGSQTYGNLTDIAAFIDETDPGSSPNATGIMFHFTSEWSLSGNTYSIQDDTSATCSTGHVGVRAKYRALNGDTYEFDAMDGMPYIVHSVTVDTTIRRSGNDVSTTDGGDSFERHDFQVVEAVVEDADTGFWYTDAGVDDTGKISFSTRHTPWGKLTPPLLEGGLSGTTTGIRIKREDFTGRTVSGVSSSETKKWHVVGWGLPHELLPIDISDVGDVSLNYASESTPDNLVVPVCRLPMPSADVQPWATDYSFDVNDRSNAPGSYAASATRRAFFTDATYKLDLAGYDNLAYGMTGTAQLGIRSNPGSETCTRCFDLTITRTDGDTSEETILFQGHIRQAVRAGQWGIPLAPEDTYPFQPLWSGQDDTDYTRVIQVNKIGKHLWAAYISRITDPSGTPPLTIYFKAGNCPDTVTDVLAFVSEVALLSETGTDDVTYESTTRLKIDAVTLDFVEAECRTPIEDPCTPPATGTYTAYSTGEVVSGNNDLKYEGATSNGGATFAPMKLADGTNPFFSFWVTPAYSWVGFDPTNAPIDGSREIRTTVTVSGGLPSAALHGRVSSDDQIVAISVNGTVRLTNVTPTDFTAWEQKWEYDLLAAWFVEGDNVVTFTLLDTSGIGSGGAAAFNNEFDA